jgi:hypothetical protein
MNALKRYLNAKRYVAKLNLLARIHTEIEPQLAALRKADDLLNGTNQESRGIENQGFTFDLAKYSANAYRLIESPRMDAPLERANDDWQIVRGSAMVRAWNEITPKLV